jgi:hypothetical protein
MYRKGDLQIGDNGEAIFKESPWGYHMRHAYPI